MWPTSSYDVALSLVLFQLYSAAWHSVRFFNLQFFSLESWMLTYDLH